MPDPIFGVVLLNWNNSHETIPCLQSLHEAAPKPEYVIVVDNASTDTSVANIQRWEQTSQPGSGWLTIIQSSTNRGFAGGNNIGIRHLHDKTSCTHILLLNNDTEVAPDFFQRMSQALSLYPDTGIATGTIYYYGDKSKVWYSGGFEVPFRALTLHKTDTPQDGAPVQTEFVSGCTMLISRSTIRKLGLLPEIYFPLYYEDAEYSHRARKAGIPIICVPEAKVYHKVGATVGASEASPYITYIQNKLRGFYIRRNYTGFDKVIASLYLLATKPAKALITVMRGRPRIAWAILSGTIIGLSSPDAHKGV